MSPTHAFHGCADMIEVEELSIRFGAATAIREATFTIQPGDRIGVVGESGCGKSMLALSLIGMTPEAARVTGSIRLEGEELAGAPDRLWRRHRARRVSMIFQEPMAALNPLKRIGETVMEPLLVHEGLTRAAARARVLSLFEEVGLPGGRLRQFPHEISGGQRQRVLIALALACNPALLIADEPTTALDATIALRITELLVRLAEERRMALLFISHDLAAIARATRDVMVVYGGDIIERGPTASVLADPAHPYTRGLIAARPRAAASPRGPGERRPRLPTIVGAVPPLAALPAGCRFSGRCPVELPVCAGQRPEAVARTGGGGAICHRLGAESLTA
ncbi:MAG: ABC transporter ATP-binding protein [Paracoccaceae bacterium]